MSRKPAAPFAANVQIACVAIDYTYYLLPMAKAMKVVELLSGAVKCERTYERLKEYRLTGEECRLEISIVQRRDIVATDATPARSAPKTLELGYDDGN